VTDVSTYDPNRVVADLRELAARTGGDEGSRRLCWTPEWLEARALLREELATLPVDIEQDEAGNLWAYLRGASPATVVVGSHLDSVPKGGWLDGCFGVMAGLELLRAVAAEGTPPCTVALVDWADEEGARFGRSLFGSAATVGTLHIEQGPVLESEGLGIGTVTGTVGIEREYLQFSGQAAHAGTMPMPMRRDSFRAAGRFALELAEIATRHDGVATVGFAQCWPGVVTAVPGETRITMDMRHIDAGELAAMYAEARAAADAAAAAEGCTVGWEPVFRIPPMPFHPRLLDAARAAVQAVEGHGFQLPSGALHDASEMARKVPTVMIFSSSIAGLSHTKEEDTPVEHLTMAAEAFHRTARDAMALVAAGEL